MRRVLTLLLISLLAVILFYVSRFWFLSLWSRPGLFGLSELRPQGGLLAQWLRGTQAAPFELLLWGAGCFVLLTWAQKVFERVTAPAKDKDG